MLVAERQGRTGDLDTPKYFEGSGKKFIADYAIDVCCRIFEAVIKVVYFGVCGVLMLGGSVIVFVAGKILNFVLGVVMLWLTCWVFLWIFKICWLVWGPKNVGI